MTLTRADHSLYRIYSLSGRDGVETGSKDGVHRTGPRPPW